MDQKIAEALIDKYLAGECTPEEQAQVENWYNQLAAQQKDLSESPDYESRNAQIMAGLPPAPYSQFKIIRLWPHIAAAASILLFTGLGFYFYQQSKQQQPENHMARNDIKPGSNKAVLTLANGKRIILTGAKNGQLANQGKTAISKTADGEVAYNVKAGKGTASAELTYNTISTPRGGQYQVILPDGSHAWLNAASSITFPTAFNGKDRQVFITGEAYFEVAHNKNKPFRVQSDKQTITVLGTHFNVNTYPDEAFVKTTLVEGSVSITTGVMQTTIKPSEQAILKDKNIQVETVDVDDVIAWKNGMFQFSDENLESIMRKLSRWYNVDIVYENTEVKALPLTGIITHFSNISKVLRMLELTKQVHFKIDGQKIIVTK